MIILALLLAPIPAPAAEKIPVTGTCIIIAFPPWFGDFDENPDYRWWESGGNEHWGNQAILNICNFNDDRLDGYYYALNGWNLFVNENSNFIARETVMGVISDEDGNDQGLWDWAGISYTDSAGGWGMKQVMKGQGMYRGLLANVTWSSPGGFPFYQIEGAAGAIIETWIESQ